MRHVSRTHQICWHQKPTRCVINGIIFSVCSNQQFQLFKLPSNDVPKHAGSERWRKNCGQIKADEFGSNKHGRAFNSAEFDCICNFGKSQSQQSWFGSDSGYGETHRWRFKWKWRGTELSIVARRCKIVSKCGEPRWHEYELKSESFSGCGETRRLGFRPLQRWFGIARRLWDFSRLYSAHGKGVIQIATDDESPPCR